MAKSRAEILQEIADSTPSGGGNNLRDGRYRFVVKKLSLENGFHGPRWTIDLVVKNCQKIPVVELKTGKAIDVDPNGIETEVGIVKMLSGKGQYEAPGLGDTKTFVLTLFNANEEDTSKAELIATLDELDKTNSAYGMQIDCVTRRKVSKEKGVEMVLQDWTHVPQTPEQIKANRVWVEGLVAQEPAAAPPAVLKTSLGPPAMGPPPPSA